VRADDPEHCADPKVHAMMVALPTYLKCRAQEGMFFKGKPQSGADFASAVR
jgi:hypothetical protein